MVCSIFFLILFCAAFHSSSFPLNIFLDIKNIILKVFNYKEKQKH